LLLESGAVELVGMTNGEPTYRITPECADIFPEFYKYHNEMLSQTANELWQMGVIELEFTMAGESVIFNKKNYKKLKEVIDILTEEQIDFLEALGAPVKRLL
jgi:hypothetical protein